MVGLALAAHIVALVHATIARPSPRMADASATTYVDAVLGPVAICTSPAGHSGGTDGAPGTEHCLLCLRIVGLETPAPAALVPIRSAAIDAPLPFIGTGVSSLAEHLRLGGVSGRGPPRATA